MRTRLQDLKTVSAKELRLLAAAALAIPFTLVPALAGAVETDRVTVEDPSTGQIMFRVTSAGNVTGATFNGDGSGLANVPHWKGVWSGAVSYAKDDCVSYGGSSYIALQPSTNALPNVDPVSWAVLAQQGPAGAAGAPGSEGPAGPQGSQGPQGPQGPAGSPDTQAQILGKVAAATAGAVLTVQQAVGEVGTNPKFSVKDSSGVDKITLTPDGMLKVESNAISPQMLLTSGTDTAGQAPTFIGRKSRGSLTVPTATQAGDNLFTLSGIGHSGSAWLTASTAIFMPARETFTPTAKGADVAFLTTMPGTTSRTEKLRITGEGNIGVGTTTPNQKLEIKDGGVRINTASTVTKPTCSSTTRGTFWLTQSGAGAMDLLEVCVKDASEAYIWKAVW